ARADQARKVEFFQIEARYVGPDPTGHLLGISDEGGRLSSDQDRLHQAEHRKGKKCAHKSANWRRRTLNANYGLTRSHLAIAISLAVLIRFARMWLARQRLFRLVSPAAS